MTMIRALFVIPSLEGGGAERVLVDLVNNIDASKFKVSVVLFQKKGSFITELPSHLEVYDLGKQNRFDVLKLVIRLATIIRHSQPNVIVSFLWYANIISCLAVYLSLTRVKLVLTVHSNLQSELAAERFTRLKTILTRRLYRLANMIIAVSKGVKEGLYKDFAIPREKLVVCYNPINITRIEQLAHEEVDDDILFGGVEAKIITVGRLSHQKDHVTLIKAFAHVRKTICAKLIILGKGPELQSLQQLAKALGISNDVFFIGFKQNPFKYLVRSDVFVLSSLFEGFGNVIVEAMACGTPVISTRCPWGPKEIIEHGETGLLVPVADYKSLAKAVLTLLTSKDLQEKLRQAGLKRARDFAVERITRDYENLFIQLLH